MPEAPYNETHWKNAEWLALVNEAFKTVDDAAAQRAHHPGRSTIEYDEGGYII